MVKKIVSRRVQWRCSVCKTKYDAKSDALACDRLPIEPLGFTVGTKVRAKELRTCAFGKNYTMRGRIVKIIGPEPPDEEYVNKWLTSMGHIPGRHTFLYEVKFTCPCCRKSKRARYYAVELTQIR